MTVGGGTPVASFDDYLAEITPQEATARICLNGRLLAEKRKLETALADRMAATAGEGSLAGDGDVVAIAGDIQALEERIDAARRPFVFRSIGRQAWRDLLGKYPPRDSDKRNGLDHNPEKFPGAAIAASAVSPTLTIDQVNELDERLNLGQFDRLWAACLEANLDAGEDPKSVAGSILRANALSAATADLAGSPGAFSSDE